MNTQSGAQENFSGMGIIQKLTDTLDHLKFRRPTPIQAKAIPIAIQGKDIVGIAQTGTGKTLAFGIPIIQQIVQSGKQALIVLPTRELALQVDETFQKIGRAFGVRSVVLIGGMSSGFQIQGLRRRPQVVIGTPGRILDLAKGRHLNLRAMNLLVLDEADRMLDMGFAPQIRRILQELPRERQSMLFSATMPENIAAIANGYMRNPVRVEVERQGTVVAKIKQELYMMNKDQKLRMLANLLNKYRGTILVFSRTKHGARKICKSIQYLGHKVAEIHSNRSLGQRKEALSGFKNGKYRVLIATDIASRGIDVQGIELIINYDIPENPEDYVHRIGRTGRAGLEGRAVSFVTPDQRAKLRTIERLIRSTIQVSRMEGVMA